MRAITGIALCFWVGCLFASAHNSRNDREIQRGLRSPNKPSPLDDIKVHIRNINFDKVLEDQARTIDVEEEGEIFATDKKPEPTWNQVFVIRRRGYDGFYSLAFDIKSITPKILADNGEHPISTRYRPSKTSHQWKFNYIVDEAEPGKYQIISVNSNLALAMQDNTTSQVNLVVPNLQDRNQLWDFRNIETDEVTYYESSTPCADGPSMEYPAENATCYSPDTSQVRPNPEDCAGYILCRPNCVWRIQQCPKKRYYNQKLQNCVPRMEADCSAGLFGDEAKVTIENGGHNLVIQDCQDCFHGPGFPAKSPVVGYHLSPERKWNQTLVAKKLENLKYYSLAFDRVEEEKFKVIYESEGEVLSKRFHAAAYGNTWRVVPTEYPDKYQILNTITRRALAMTKKTYYVYCPGCKKMEMQIQDPNSQDQLFTFTKVVDGVSSSGFPRRHRNKCQKGVGSTGSSERMPTPNSQCYQEDLKVPSPNSCRAYLECDSNHCEWREKRCQGSRYWNNAQKRCVRSKKQANCGGYGRRRENRQRRDQTLQRQWFW